MSIVTSQQILRYYEQYKGTDVTFNKQVISAVGLVPKGIFIKFSDRQISCTVFSSSMSSARVIANVPSGAMAALKSATNRLSLRWCFKLPDKSEPITFFVTCRPTAFTHYAVQGPDVHFITLQFTQRPPDDLILILGSLLEAKLNSQKRRDERIIITPETMKKLGLETREASLLIDGRPSKCVLRDLSFSGANVVVSGPPAAFADKSVTLRFAPGDQLPDLAIPGRVCRVDEISGRKLLTISVEYSGEPPMSYKLLINSYVSTLRKAAQSAEQAPAEKAAAAAPAAAEPVAASAEAPPDGPEEAPPDAEPAAISRMPGTDEIPDEANPEDEAGGTESQDG